MTGNNTKRGHARATAEGLIAKGWVREDAAAIWWKAGVWKGTQHFFTFHQAVKLQQQRERGE
jgi:hypothetical protein